MTPEQREQPPPQAHPDWMSSPLLTEYTDRTGSVFTFGTKGDRLWEFFLLFSIGAKVGIYARFFGDQMTSTKRCNEICS
jgi:hypothetical protein